MILNQMEIINLKLEKNCIPLFEELLNEALANDNHRNKKNYDTIIDDIDKHIAFFMVLNNNELVFFEGMRGDIYDENIARIMNRHYTNPKYRLPLGTKQQYKKRMNSSNITVPMYIDIAKELKLDAVFWSTEGIFRKRHINTLVSWQNEIYNGFQFKVLPDMYHVCRTVNDNGVYIGLNDSSSCWQNVVMCSLVNDDYTFPLPSMLEDKWRKLWISHSSR